MRSFINSKSFYINILVCFILIITSCTHGWKKYIIKAGNHSSNALSEMMTGVRKVEFYFKVDNSWYYDQPGAPGWNKIRGFSEGHHQNQSSARLSYQCINDTMLIIGAYCYVDGVSPQQNNQLKGTIDTIQANKTYHCRIIKDNGKYMFYFEDKYWECLAGQDVSWGYYLNPYIGGDFTLDHDWVVEIRDIR